MEEMPVAPTFKAEVASTARVKVPFESLLIDSALAKVRSAPEPERVMPEVPE